MQYQLSIGLNDNVEIFEVDLNSEQVTGIVNGMSEVGSVLHQFSWSLVCIENRKLCRKDVSSGDILILNSKTPVYVEVVEKGGMIFKDLTSNVRYYWFNVDVDSCIKRGVLTRDENKI